jgi:hypothetical protein
MERKQNQNQNFPEWLDDKFFLGQSPRKRPVCLDVYKQEIFERVNGREPATLLEINEPNFLINCTVRIWRLESSKTDTLTYSDYFVMLTKRIKRIEEERNCYPSKIADIQNALGFSAEKSGDIAQALKYYKLAADQGYAVAQMNLARLLLDLYEKNPTGNQAVLAEALLYHNLAVKQKFPAEPLWKKLQARLKKENEADSKAILSEQNKRANKYQPNTKNSTNIDGYGNMLLGSIIAELPPESNPTSMESLFPAPARNQTPQKIPAPTMQPTTRHPVIQNPTPTSQGVNPGNQATNQQPRRIGVPLGQKLSLQTPYGTGPTNKAGSSTTLKKSASDQQNSASGQPKTHSQVSNERMNQYLGDIDKSSPFRMKQSLPTTTSNKTDAQSVSTNQQTLLQPNPQSPNSIQQKDAKKVDSELKKRPITTPRQPSSERILVQQQKPSSQQNLQVPEHSDSAQQKETEKKDTLGASIGDRKDKKVLSNSGGSQPRKRNLNKKPNTRPIKVKMLSNGPENASSSSASSDSDENIFTHKSSSSASQRPNVPNQNTLSSQNADASQVSSQQTQIEETKKRFPQQAQTEAQSTLYNPAASSTTQNSIRPNEVNAGSLRKVGGSSILADHAIDSSNDSLNNPPNNPKNNLAVLNTNTNPRIIPLNNKKTPTVGFHSAGSWMVNPLSLSLLLILISLATIADYKNPALFTHLAPIFAVAAIGVGIVGVIGAIIFAFHAIQSLPEFITAMKEKEWSFKTVLKDSFDWIKTHRLWVVGLLGIVVMLAVTFGSSALTPFYDLATDALLSGLTSLTGIPADAVFSSIIKSIVMACFLLAPLILADTAEVVITKSPELVLSIKEDGLQEEGLAVAPLNQRKGQDHIFQSLLSQPIKPLYIYTPEEIVHAKATGHYLARLMASPQATHNMDSDESSDESSNKIMELKVGDRVWIRPNKSTQEAFFVYQTAANPNTDDMAHGYLDKSCLQKLDPPPEATYEPYVYTQKEAEHAAETGDYLVQSLRGNGRRFWVNSDESIKLESDGIGMLEGYLLDGSSGTFWIGKHEVQKLDPPPPGALCKPCAYTPEEAEHAKKTSHYLAKIIVESGKYKKGEYVWIDPNLNSKLGSSWAYKIDEPGGFIPTHTFRELTQKNPEQDLSKVTLSK